MPILTPGQFIRMIYINWVLMRHGLDDIIFTTHLFRPFRFLMYIFPWNWFRGERKPRAVRMREALQDLGPIFIKFGQMLSTRRDLLADDIADELQQLQDNVPAFPGKNAVAIIEKAFGETVGELFKSFEEQPLASASIAQVHAAVLKTGENVVVKVLRPDVLPVIKRDISLLYVIAELAAKYSSQLRRLRPVEVIEEYEKTILDELDLLREAANASQLRRNFEGSNDLYVPEIYWDFVRKNVLVMERIYGTPIRDIESLKEQGTDMERLAAMGVEIFFTQVFTHNFFHADMHPGNIFVDTDNPKSPKYIAVDFGIMGTLSQTDKRYLAENFLAFFQRDYFKVAKLHVESGWVPSHTRVDEFESAIRSVCEPIFEKPLKEISFGQLLLRLFQTARRFNMEVQPQLVLLQKTLLNIEGLGRQLYPDLDLWKTAKPFLENWMQEQVGPRALFRNLKDDLPYMIEKMPEMPGLIYKSLKAYSDGEYQLKQMAEIKKIRDEIKRNSQRGLFVLGGSGMIISASVIYTTAISVPVFWTVPVASWVLAVPGLLLLGFGLRR
ncbi:Ubiquinone biosynthesis regulatory protein kinase UbiB [hydrothermal vent metagenome]|uniref:Ubiquinone biosynthesis regulatory protein kinase UbiB n=1 Tax=hydrothermal vent metagenome TaxID=652676 RepID=A0A3B0WVI7_9ZZZZ